MKDLSFTTKLIHAGERRPHPIGQAVSTPIYPSVTYTYSSMEELDKVFSGEGGDYVYSRYGNPTVAALQEAMRTIENGKVAVAYGSGMAAIHAALLACDLQSGSTVIASQDLYGASFDLLYKIFGPLGIKTQIADFADIDSLKEKVESTKPRILLGETISNPLLKVLDIPAVADIAHRNGAKLIVDNTFASPYLCQPLDLGADFTVHSATKYLGGHADAMGGIVVSNEEADAPALVGTLKLAGGVLSVYEAHQILRGIKTLALRVEKQCENAESLARALSKNDRISQVFYPALNEASTTKKVLREPFGGALVTLRLKEDTREAAFRFMDALEVCIRGTSLGDVYTLASHSASSSHRELSPKRRADLGITEGLVRFSVGIEDVSDILSDIERALSK